VLNLTIKYSRPDILSRMIIFLETKQRPHSFCSSLVFPRLTNGISGFDIVLLSLVISNVIAVGTSQFLLGCELCVCHTLYYKAIPSTKNVSDFNPTVWRNSILHCENLTKADWLTMMGIRDVPSIMYL
jgi:hypothetical protein